MHHCRSHLRFSPFLRHTLLGTLLLSQGACSSGSDLELDAASKRPQKLSSSLLPLRSLAVSEEAIVDHFLLEDVLSQLLEQASDTTQTPHDLFQAWMGQNDDCEEVVDGSVTPYSFNGFPFTCRPSEIPQEQSPFAGSGAYQATALFNRFDLTPVDGANCGEYRIVFKRNSVDAGTRKNIIFEAQLTNPQPELGREGCRPVAEFWAALSLEDDINARATLLHDFYFQGLSGFDPVIAVTNYAGRQSSGQIRSNSFLGGTPWSLREFSLKTDCSDSCFLSFERETIAESPFPELAGALASDPRAQDFQDWFIDSLTPSAGILSENENTLVLVTPEQFLGGEGVMEEFIGAPSPAPVKLADEMSPGFEQRLEDKLLNLGSQLSAQQVMNRANAASCVGCHRSASSSDLGGGLNFPSSLGFRHVGERAISGQSADGSAYEFSPALLQEFIPYRQTLLETFLAESAGSELSVTFSLASEWSTGYCANVQVENQSGTAQEWLLSLDLAGSTLSNSWSATFSDGSALIMISPPSWAAALAPNASHGFGFCATKGTPFAMPILSSNL